MLWLFITPGAEENPNGRPGKLIMGANTILQIAFIGEMDEFRVVDKDDKGRWLSPDLGAIVEPQMAPISGRWHRFVIGVAQQLIQFARR